MVPGDRSRSRQRPDLLGLLSPLVATGLGWVVLDQRLTAVQAVGAALVVAAVILPQLRLHRRVPARVSVPDCVAIVAIGVQGAPQEHRHVPGTT